MFVLIKFPLNLEYIWDDLCENKDLFPCLDVPAFQVYNLMH